MTDGRATVVRAITRLNIGGPARQALLLTRALAETHPTVLVTGTPPPEEGELSDPAVTPRRVPLVRPLRPVDDARALAALRGILRRTDARILHTHMAKAGTLGRIASLTVRPRPWTIHTFHGHVLEGYFGGATQRAFIEVERRLAARTDVLVAISDEVLASLLELGIGRREQYVVIPLGFDLGEHLARRGEPGTLRSSLGLAPGTPLIGSVGRLVPIKDHETLLEAMCLLPGVHLALLGDGELRTHLEGLTERLGLADRVHFVGWWTHMPSALADLDVVVLTSRNEGTPVALIEALACARPVVATDVGGVRAVVRDGVTGRVVPAQRPDEVAAAVRRSLDRPEESAALALAGREHVRTTYAEERLVADIRALYDDLLARSRR